jgi:hypothetical protein
MASVLFLFTLSTRALSENRSMTYLELDLDPLDLRVRT